MKVVEAPSMQYENKHCLLKVVLNLIHYESEKLLNENTSRKFSRKDDFDRLEEERMNYLLLLPINNRVGRI